MRTHHLVMLVILAAVPARALADGKKLDPAAQAHLDAGLKAYGDKQYDVASREFELGYQIDPDPSLLYAGAQALRLGGDCKKALVVYRKYLESKPKEDQVTAANTGISQCEAKLAAEPKPEPVKPEPAKPEPVKPVEPSPIIEPKPVAEPRWYTDPIGGSLVAGGALGIGVGIGLFVSGSSAEDKAKTAEFRDDFQDLLDKATSRKRFGAIAITAGVGLAAGGVLVYTLRHRGHPTVVGTTGQTLFIAGAF